MKKQFILLLVASAAIGSLDAAAGYRLGAAARGAFIGGGRAATGALPKGVSNTAKQAARFRTFGSSKYDTSQANALANREIANRKFAQSGPMMNSAWGQFKNWFNNLFANRSRAALATGATIAGGSAATYGWLKNQPIAYAEEEVIVEEPKSRINEFKHFFYTRSYEKNKGTYEIKAVETPEDIRLYLKNPHIIFDQPIREGSVFVTDAEGKNLILKDYKNRSETIFQLPEITTPNTPIKYIKISDNEIELILPRNPGLMPAWWYEQTINVFKPHGNY